MPHVCITKAMPERAVSACQSLMRLLAMCFVMLSASHTVVASENFGVSDCEAGSNVTLNVPPLPELLEFRVEAAADAIVLVELEELGQDLTIATFPTLAGREVRVPPRLGVSFFRLESPNVFQIQRVRPGRAQGELRLTLQCRSQAMDELWGFLQSLDEVGRSIEGGIGSIQSDDPLDRLQEMVALPSEPRTRAWIQHLCAQVLLLAGRAADASREFIQAATLWADLGDARRTAAALTAAAEDHNRSGQYREAISLVERNVGGAEGGDYYAARLENTKCLALHYLGDLAGATECYAVTSAQLEHLGEVLELASTSLNFAAVERSSGRFDQARSLALKSLEISTGPQSGVIQGRAHYTLADIAMRSGDVSEALTRLRLAQERFAEGKEVRWEANALLYMAGLLRDLRAYGDARSVADRALEVLEPQHGPARIAAAQMVLAGIDLEEGYPQKAIEGFRLAEATYTSLEMPEELATTRIELVRALLAAGQTEAAKSVIAGLGDQRAHLSRRLKLVRAELELTSDGEGGRATLDIDSTAAPLSLAEMIRHRRIEAWRSFHQGDHRDALSGLMRFGRELAEVASRTGNPLLSHAIRQSIRDVRKTALEILGRSNPDEMTADKAAEVALAWIGLTAAPSAGPKDVNGDDYPATAVDKAVAGLLLSRSDKNVTEPVGDLWIPLLELLARHGGTPRVSLAPADHEEVLPRLRRNGSALALLSAETNLVVLWMDSAGSRFQVLPSSAEIRSAVGELAAELSTPLGNRDRITTLSDFLSREVLRGLTDIRAPESLQVLNDDLGAEIPWNLIVWPGSESPLIHGTTITFVEPSHDPRIAGLVQPGSIEFVQSAHQDASSAMGILPRLEVADAERAMILENWGGGPVNFHRPLNRAKLVSLVSTPSAWLHVSAHGVFERGLLAGSGLWVDPEEVSRPPEYVSWMDLHAHGAQASMIVLNACHLAANDEIGETASMSFATALSRAGVQHVIASRWPVSDTASNLWVPAFYAALSGTDSPDPGFALAEANRRLRASRAFSHPFYWAAWVHISRR